NGMEMAYGMAQPSKKDRKKQIITEGLAHLQEAFLVQKDHHYRRILQDLQSKLTGIRLGTDPEFLEMCRDLEESRDYYLVELKLWDQYQRETALKEFQAEKDLINEDHANRIQAVRSKLIARLEGQRKRLREDKDLLDIANDHSLMLSGGTHDHYTRSDSHQPEDF
ncbi:hypothetical protein CANCADRAFT_16351, partial [Tortispora caseinolytica NRRL Y-17796]